MIDRIHPMTETVSSRAAGLGITRCLATLLLAAGCAGNGAAENSDLVNERPPVNVEQLQQHWGVDCPALRREILSANDPQILSEFRVKQLAQCAIIRQRFPKAWSLPCNGYQRALEAARPGPPAAAALASVQRALRCEPDAPPAD